MEAELARLRATNAGLREVIAGQAVQIEALVAKIAELERRLSSDSSTSSNPAALVGPALPEAGAGMITNLGGAQTR